MEERLWDTVALSNLVVETQNLDGKNKLEDHDDVALRLTNATGLYMDEAQNVRNVTEEDNK